MGGDVFLVLSYLNVKSLVEDPKKDYGIAVKNIEIPPEED